jgi:signal transduction histidine kinase/ligand-binding sensor domain-containing protein
MWNLGVQTLAAVVDRMFGWVRQALPRQVKEVAEPLWRKLQLAASTLVSTPVPTFSAASKACATRLIWMLLLVVLPWDGLKAAQPMLRLFTTEDGLARNWVKRIRSDHAGRLWFCTVEGLSVFDGERFTNYTVADGLPNRYVSDFLDAGDAGCWIIGPAGLFRFRPRGGAGRAAAPVFTKIVLDGVEDPTDFSQQGEAVLLQSRDGQIFAATGGGLFRVENPGGVTHAALVSLPRSNPRAGQPEVHAIASAQDGSLWLSAGDRLVRLLPDGQLASWGTETGIPAFAKALLCDREGHLWAGGWGALYELDIEHERPVVLTEYTSASVPPSVDVQALFQDADGDIWLAGKGLALLKRFGRASGSWSTFEQTAQLASQNISSIATDSQGNLWLAVSNIGAARILRHGFQIFTESDGLKSRHVISVFDTRQGQVYAVTEPRILHEFDGERFTAIPMRLPNRIQGVGWGESSVVLQTRTGEWWAAAAGGLVRFAPVASTRDLSRVAARVYGPAEGLPFDPVLRLFEEREGAVWATGRGAVRWDPATNKFQDFTPALDALVGNRDEDYPLAYAQDRVGAVWMGVGLGKIFRLRNGRFEEVRYSPPSGAINGLFADREGRVWIASSQGGLGRIDEPSASSPQIRWYTQAKGLASNHLFAVTQDHAGRIYVAGGQGVDRLDPATGTVRHYSTSDGLPPGETQRMYCDHAGAIWFASNFGLSRYEPESDRPAVAATPKIHGVRAGGKAVMVSDDGESSINGLEVPAGRDDIEITYGAVDFSVGHGPRYQYRLQPVDGDWRKPTSLRSAQYARLGAGAYIFEARGISNDGRPGEGLARVQFQVLAPFWQRWWFVALAGASLVGLAYSAHTYRLRHILAVQRIRTRLAADLHDNMGSGLAEIAIVAEVAKQKAQPQEALAMELVAERARELRATMGDIVWSVDPASDNLTGVIRRWRLAAANLLNNVSLVFNAPPESQTDSIAMRPDQRRHLLLLFKEAITNVARHANAASVSIDVTLADGELRLSVQDDGRGFSVAENSWGNGLRGMAHRADELKGRFEIQSNTGAGTRVDVRLPV